MPLAAVRYQRFETAPVADVVEHAWVVRDDGAPSPELLLPDGRGLLQVVVAGAGSRVDPLGGTRADDGSGVRGLTTRAVVRVGDAGTRLGLQLHPLAGARLGVALTDDWRDVDAVLGTGVLAAVEALLADGSDRAAVGLLTEALGALPRQSSHELDRFADVVDRIDEAGGLVTVAELARAAGSTVSDVFRWSVAHLGVPPREYLSAVRFSRFVREAVGPGVVRPADVVATLQWYVRAGYAPREVERFTGLEPADLRRLTEGVAALLGG